MKEPRYAIFRISSGNLCGTFSTFEEVLEDFRLYNEENPEETGEDFIVLDFLQKFSLFVSFPSRKVSGLIEETVLKTASVQTPEGLSPLPSAPSKCLECGNPTEGVAIHKSCPNTCCDVGPLCYTCFWKYYGVTEYRWSEKKCPS